MSENHSPFKNESRLKRADHDTAKKLSKEFNLDVKSQGYHYKGDFYNELELYTYPVAFFDLYGYIIIKSERELKSKMDVTKRVHKFGGISRMPQYIRYSHDPKSIENYNEIIKEENKAKERRLEQFEKFNNIMKRCISINREK